MIDALLEQLNNDPENLSFDAVMETIAANYDYSPTRFLNGVEGDLVVNEAGTNEGSCKLFAFAKLQNLNPEQTLACFGKYYRDDVLGNPAGDDHQNIRTFMRHGWGGISFDADVLAPKS